MTDMAAITGRRTGGARLIRRLGTGRLRRGAPASRHCSPVPAGRSERAVSELFELLASLSEPLAELLASPYEPLVSLSEPLASLFEPLASLFEPLASLFEPLASLWEPLASPLSR